MSPRPTSLHLSPAEVAEHDGSRSRFMQRLITETDRNSQPTSRPKVPRLLVQYWDDASTVPGDVQSCLDSWIEIPRAIQTAPDGPSDVLTAPPARDS